MKQPSIQTFVGYRVRECQDGDEVHINPQNGGVYCYPTQKTPSNVYTRLEALRILVAWLTHFPVFDARLVKVYKVTKKKNGSNCPVCSNGAGDEEMCSKCREAWAKEWR